MNLTVAPAVRRSIRPWLFGVAMAASSAAALAADASDDEVLEEVVVTAQFREQRLQDTPIAITAVNSEGVESNRSATVSKTVT